jgi:hypothetical protein
VGFELTGDALQALAMALGPVALFYTPKVRLPGTPPLSADGDTASRDEPAAQ